MLEESTGVGVVRHVSSHRASYRLEVGIWRARCKVCGWEVTHPVRRQAASIFRRHIVAVRNGDGAGLDIDLRDAVMVVVEGRTSEASPLVVRSAAPNVGTTLSSN